MKKMKGFTLVELMIVVAIIGLLVIVGIPSYQRSILKSNRADAQISLSRLSTLQEQYFFRTNQYTDDFADMVNGVSTGTSAIDSDEGHYSIALTLTGSGTGWSMTATPQGSQAADTSCATITMNSLGVRTAADSSTAANPECWR